MQELKELIRKYNEGTCTAEEKAFVESWYQLFDLRKGEELPQSELLDLKEQVWLSMQNKQKAVELSVVSKTPHYRRWYYVAAAVVAAAILGLSVFQFYFREGDQPLRPVQEEIAGGDVAPGTSKAQLVLGNGKVVDLSAQNEGLLTEADGTVIDRQSGRLIYNQNDGELESTYNTLIVPKGGEYQLLLSDGSKVWMNAASSLRYPTRFNRKERLLYLDGEAYFDVKRNTKLPFKVVTEDGVVVEVLGTKFNVMSYNDEKSVKTALESGSVKVVSRNKSVLLSPSQVGEWQKENKNLNVQEGDLDKILAWKNGMIEFRDDDIELIMRQISRWYDIEIVFTGRKSQGRYSGSIRRQSQLSKVLEILKAGGVQCYLEGRKLIVE
ncbi:MAG: FecR family protein [Chitinophagaceae bacterium]|nr:FecR family protein [Chitinophagaceae bacterium]